MRKRTAGLAAALTVGLLVAPSCGKVAEKAAEKATEKAIEGQTGGKVDIGKDGKVTFKDSNGETQMQVDDSGLSIKTSDGEAHYGEGAEVPDGWPEVLALPKGAKVRASTTTPDGLMVVFTASDSPKELVSSYDSQLTDDGWSQTSSSSLEGMMMNAYEKDSAAVTITAMESSETDGASDVNITYSKGEASGSDTATT